MELIGGRHDLSIHLASLGFEETGQSGCRLVRVEPSIGPDFRCCADVVSFITND